MAITAKKYLKGFTGSDTAIVEPYLVRTDSKTTSWAQILASGALPKRLDQHPDNPNFKIQTGGIVGERMKRGDEDKGQDGLWLATVTYTEVGNSFDRSNQPQLDRLISFEIQTRTYTRTAENAYERQRPFEEETTESPDKVLKIVNSADDIFDPASLQEEYYHPVMVFLQREEISFDYLEAVSFMGSINQGVTNVLGLEIPEGKAMMRKVAPRLVVNEEGDQEWQCMYEVELVEDIDADEDDWWLRILDIGFQAYFGVASNREKRKIKQSDLPNSPVTAGSEEDTEVNDAVVLDGNGQIEQSQGQDPPWWRYRTRPYKDWETGLNMIKEKIELR